MINDIKIAENFNLKEFECTGNGHHHVIVDNKLVEKLQVLRSFLNKPLYVNSAYRCPERNEEVGGAKKSQHLTGKAADISLRNLEINIKKLSKKAAEIGFTGIGLYNSFIHLDVRELPQGKNSPIIWNGR